MTNIFKNAESLMSETLNKIILKEDEDKFVSVIDQKDTFDSSKLNANIYDDTNTLDPDKEEEKNKLTSQAIEKIKQNLKVSDELQSILNRIDKLNKDVKANDWQVNEEKNTAILRSKNARIFKQNDNLCLSHNGKIELFKSVKELHDWLKKNNYPLPKNIKLHESNNNPYILLGKICQHSDENSWIQKKARELANGFEHGDIDWSTFYNRLNDLLLLNNFKIDESTITEEDEIPNENAPVYDFINDDSELSRLKNRYKDTRWANIIGHRWGDLGKVIDVMTPEERAEQQRQDSWANTYNSINKMSREQEKDARRMNDIKLVKNIFGDGPNMVYNDLHSYMGQFANNEKAYKDAIEQLKQNKAEKNKENTDKEQTKTEAFDDNQLDNEEIWYLEYQTNIPEEKSYLNSAWKEADLLSDNLDNAAKFISREKAINELQELYMTRKTTFPFKPVLVNDFNECGCGGCATTVSGLGSAVQYVGNKKESINEEIDPATLYLDEAQRQDFRDRVALDRELIKIANIKDFDGNIIGKAGKTIKEYAANKEFGFDDEKDPQGYITYTTENGKDVRIDDGVLNRRIALDSITNQPIGMIDTTGKVRNLKGNKIIGYSDTREAAKNRGIDLDKLSLDSEHDDNFQFTQKAGQQWAGKRDSITNKYVNKIGFFNPETGEIKNKYKDTWSELTKNNPKLRDNPEIMHDMFTDYIKDGKILDPETFKQRVLQINDVFGINLNPEDEIIPSKMKKDSPQQQEFYKWRDTYYKPLFNASRRKDKATHKINADKDVFSKEQDEWRATANDRENQEQSIQYFINDMNNKTDDFVNRKIGGFELTNAFQTFINNEAIPNRLKSSMAKKIYSTIEDEQGPDMAQMFKMMNQNWFNQEESVLTEDDSPADFADGSVNIASDMSAATTDQTTTQTDTISNDMSDYGLEEPEMNSSPNFGDININANVPNNEEAQMPEPENKRIVDVLVNENDPTQIKLKTKDMNTNKIEIKDLSEIDV